MITDQRTGTRSITPAGGSFGAVALISVSFGTLLRCIDGRAGGLAGVIMTLAALAVVSRYRISWDRQGIRYQNPLWARRKRWTELIAYEIEPRHTDAFNAGPVGPSRRAPVRNQRFLLRLLGDRGAMTIGLRLYSYQDIRHLTDAVSTELPVHENASALVS